jgi:hypothetical protein
LRGVNLSDASINLKLKPSLPYLSVELVNLDESYLGEVKTNDEAKLNYCGCHKIVTLFFRIAD